MAVYERTNRGIEYNTDGNDDADVLRDMQHLAETTDSAIDDAVQEATYDDTALKARVTANEGDIADIKSEQIQQNTDIQINENAIQSLQGTVTAHGQTLENLSNNKVDKVQGKGLSTEDYSTAEKTKLAGIEAEANKTIVDSSLSSSSENPVQNKVINASQEEQNNKIQALETDVEDLRNNSLQVTGSGSNFQLSPTAKARFIELFMKGNTEQESYEGKNLLDTIKTSSTQLGLTITPNSDGSITFVGTTNGGGTIVITNPNNPPIISAGTYTLSVKTIGTITKNGKYVLLGGRNSSSAQIFTDTTISENSTASKTATTTSENTMNNILVYISGEGVSFNCKMYFQLEENSTTTDWEKYVGGIPAPNPFYECPIKNVTGNANVKIQNKNLLEITENNKLTRCTYVSGANTNQYKLLCTASDMYVNETINAGSSYEQSKNGNLIECAYGETIYFNTGNSLFGKNYFTEFDENLISLGNYSKTISSGTYTPTNANCKYVTFRFGYGSSAVAGTTYTLAPIVAKTSDTSYVEHQEQNLPLTLGNIELCKIPNTDIKDFFFKAVNGNKYYDSLTIEEKEALTYGKWYLHKEIGKVVLDGSETNISKEETTSYIRYQIKGVLPLMKQLLQRNKVTSNYFHYSDGNDIGTIFAHYGNYGSVFLYPETTITTVELLQSWLSAHNTMVYYPLQIPTNTEETDTTLINQLEAYLQAYSYINETNISATSSDIEPIISATAIRSLNDILTRLEVLESEV